MNLEFRILDGPQAGRRLAVGQRPITFGRSAGMDQSFPQDSFMSGTHLSVQAVREGLELTDLRSTNGTFLNGERITQGIAKLGDVVKIGNLSLKVVMTEAPISGKVLSSPLTPQSPPRPMTGSPGVTTVIMLPGAGAPAEAPASPLPAAVAAAKPPKTTEAVLRALREVPGPLYCLLDAAADDMLPSLVAVACEDAGKHHLLEGAPVSPTRCTPYLLALAPESTLLPVLVRKGWGLGWASYFTSSADYSELYQHFRKFLMVQVGGGGEIYFRFYDPRVLRSFLPSANSTELSMFFGPVQDWLLEADDPGLLLKMKNTGAGLQAVSVSVQSPAAE